MAVRRPPVFCGRASEREVLDRLLETAQSGASAVLVVHGEPRVVQDSFAARSGALGCGYFAAWEQPELFSAELRAAFKFLREEEGRS